MELRHVRNSVLKKLAEKLCTDDLSKFGLEYQLQGNQLVFGVDRYYFVVVKRKAGRLYLRCKSAGMVLDSDWFLVLDEDRIGQRIVKLLLTYMLKDRDVRS